MAKKPVMNDPLSPQEKADLKAPKNFGLTLVAHSVMVELGRFLELYANHENATDLNSRHGWEIDMRNQYKKLNAAYQKWAKEAVK